MGVYFTSVDRCCKYSLRRLAMALRIGPLSRVATASKTGPKTKKHVDYRIVFNSIIGTKLSIMENNYR